MPFSDSNKTIADIITESHDSSSTRSSQSNSTKDSSISEKSSKDSSSVLNMPMKPNSVVENIYGMFEGHVMNNLGDILNIPDFNLTPKVSSDDFQGYVESLKGTYHAYVKGREQSSQESFDRENIDSSRSLLDCYHKVPTQYFETDFQFNFFSLDENNEELMKLQSHLEENLDQINMNLCGQISEKFGTILMAIQDLTEQENKIKTCVEAIRRLRAINQELKETHTRKILEVLKQKRKLLNMQKTIQVLETVNLVKKVVPTLQHLIQRGNFESAVNLLNGSEQTFKDKLDSVKSMQIFNTKFQEARVNLQQFLMVEFDKISIDCFTKSLSYNTIKESFPSSNPNTFDQKAQDQLCKIVLAHIKMKEVSLSSFRPKFHEILKKFHKQFLDDTTEFLNRIEKEKLKEESLSIDHKIQSINFYFQMFQGFYLQFTKIHNEVIQRVVNYFEDKWEKENISPNTSDMKVLSSTIQEFNSIYSIVIRNFNDKIPQIIQTVDIRAISKDYFLKFSMVLEKIISCFKVNFENQQKFYSSIIDNKEVLKKALNKILLGSLDQMSVSPLINLKFLTEKQFIQIFIQNRKNSLQTKLKNETWKVVEIPENNFESLKFFHSLAFELSAPLSLPVREEEQLKLKEGSDEGEAPLTPIDKLSGQNGILMSEQNYEILIKKKSLVMDGNNYKVTESHLELVQTISEFYIFSDRLAAVRDESLAQIFAFAKIFVTSIDHDILKGNSTSNAIGGVITPEMLAFAALSLILLKQGMETLQKRLERKSMDTKFEKEMSQIKQTAEGLISDLLNKISEILRDVVFIEKGNLLKSTSWEENMTIPTNITTQTLEKIKGVCKSICKHLFQDHLAVVYRLILKDLEKYYVTIFEDIDVKNNVVANNVKDELKYFNSNLKQVLFSGEIDCGFQEFEERVTNIIDMKCGAFIELASINDE